MATLYTEPWEHLIADNFLSADALERSLADIELQTYEFDIEYRGTGRIEFSLLKSEILWRSVYSRSTIALLEHAFGCVIALNRQNLLQLRQMDENTPAFPLHNDYVAGAYTIASFLYLSPGWSSACGGRFNIYASDVQELPSSSVEPVQNRFLAFRTDPKHWHSVERVHKWHRLGVLALWDATNL